MLCVDMVRSGAARYADRTAVMCGERSLTFREVDQAASRIANILRGLGAASGDRIGLLVGNGIWSMSLDFACLKAGVARVPLNSRLSAVEHERMLAETGTRFLVYDVPLTERALALQSAVDGLTLICLGASDQGHLDLLDEMSQASAADPMLPADRSDPVLLSFTSGTTGTLKAAVHTQSSFAGVASNILANLVSPQRGDVMLHAASLIHASGTFILPYWLRGGAAAVLPGFDPDTYLDEVSRYQATAINLVPTMIGMLFRDGAPAGDRSSLRDVFYGASPMPAPLLAEATEAWGPLFSQYYGQTEAPLCISVLNKADHEDVSPSSCGHPSVDVELKLTDDDGNPVAAGEVGEIRLRAPFGMAGYYNAPELTAATMTDGWIRTRDLARIDDRGYMYLVERTSDMIITGGYNVYPREVEDAIFGHPAVSECAVVGAPDPKWVEAVTAFVSLKPGASVTAAELQEQVRSQLAGYKVPKRIEFVEDLPKSAVGKILRRAVRDPLWVGHDRSTS